MWFEASPCFMFHVSNAFEEVGPDGVTTIVVLGCRLPQFEMNFGDDALEGQALYEWRFVLSQAAAPAARAAGQPLPVAEERVILQTAADFPQTNPLFQGKKHRYTYMAGNIPRTRRSAVNAPAGPLFDSVMKVDHSLVPADGPALQEGGGGDGSGACQTIFLPEGVYCGETCFLASDRPGRNAAELDEDDGFLVTFAHDENNQTSWLLVFDAKTMDTTPVASFKLPNRVPYGFHALWVSDTEVTSSTSVRAKL